MRRILHTVNVEKSVGRWSKLTELRKMYGNATHWPKAKRLTSAVLIDVFQGYLKKLTRPNSTYWVFPTCAWWWCERFRGRGSCKCSRRRPGRECREFGCCVWRPNEISHREWLSDSLRSTRPILFATREQTCLWWKKRESNEERRNFGRLCRISFIAAINAGEKMWYSSIKLRFSFSPFLISFLLLTKSGGFLSSSAVAFHSFILTPPTRESRFERMYVVVTVDWRKGTDDLTAVLRFIYFLLPRWINFGGIIQYAADLLVFRNNGPTAVVPFFEVISSDVSRIEANKHCRGYFSAEKAFFAFG